jgi:hypothetical protein
MYYKYLQTQEPFLSSHTTSNNRHNDQPNQHNRRTKDIQSQAPRLFKVYACVPLLVNWTTDCIVIGQIFKISFSQPVVRT